MKVIVYEHVSGGGYAQKSIPIGVLAEGYAMLRCISADFKAAGHEVTVFLDSRISKLNPPLEADYIVPIFYADEPRRFLSNIAKINDAVYIIAPETSQTLQLLVKQAEETGKTSLNSRSDVIAEVSDKTRLYEKLKKNGLQTPKTAVLNNTDNLKQIQQTVKREFTFPVIFKPIDGAGCSGISIVQGESDIKGAIVKIKAESINTHFIAQEYLEGTAVSVSELCTEKNSLSLTLNEQNIHLASQHDSSIYIGGCVPIDHRQKKDAFETAAKVVESFSGLRGYIGIDLIYAKDKIFVLDVNARLTTSYVGLRQVVDFNVAQAIVDCVVDGKIPNKKRILGISCFSKIQTPKLRFGGYDRYKMAVKLCGLVSPPFPLKDCSESTSLIMGYGENLADAKLRLEEAKKLLCSIFS